MRIRAAAVVVSSLLVFGCGSSSSSDGGGADAGTAPAHDAGPSTPLTRVWLPQAVGNALWANPQTYQQVPLHIATEGDAASISVRVGGRVILAADADGDGTWTALLPIADLGVGEFDVEVTARDARDAQQTASANLGVGINGVQFTSVPMHGNAGTPRLHNHGGALWLTWTDARDGVRKAWLQQVTGAGTGLGDPVALVEDERDTLYARASFGTDSIGVLYQHPGGPYDNYFRMVDVHGGERVAPIALDPTGTYGSFGGDISFDGEAYVIVWRSNNGNGKSELLWLRIDERTGAVTGPVVVASSGADDPHGSFDPFTFIGVETVGTTSVVSFTRPIWDNALEFAIPACQVARVDDTGTVMTSERAGLGGGFWWDYECRVFAKDDRAVVLWSRQDLTSADNNPPTWFAATASDSSASFDAGRGNGAVVLTAPEHRAEPFLIAGLPGDDLLLWTDSRSYQNIQTGRIELYAANVGDDLSAGTADVFGHARFIESTSQLNGVAAGSNAIIVWIDERHGSGILDPKPEIYFETVWR